jgi:transposase
LRERLPLQLRVVSVNPAVCGRFVGKPETIPPTVADLVLRRSASNGINTRMRNTRDLTDEQWQTLDPLIPRPRKRRDGRGRPWKSRRSVLNGVLWVLRTGAPWADLPDRYPSYQTCHRRFQQWVRFGVMTRIMTVLAHELSIRGAIDVSEAFIDASFAPAKKGGARSEKRNAAREQRSWRLQIVMGCQFLFAQRVPLPTK